MVMVANWVRCLLSGVTQEWSCPSGIFGAYSWPSFPDQNTAQHSSRSSSQTLFLKPPLPSQWPTIPFSCLFFPDNLPFWGKFTLTLLRIHPLSLGFSPFWDIGDLLYFVYHLSHPNTIRMCHLPAIEICVLDLLKVFLKENLNRNLPMKCDTIHCINSSGLH